MLRHSGNDKCGTASITLKHKKGNGGKSTGGMNVPSELQAEYTGENCPLEDGGNLQQKNAIQKKYRAASSPSHPFLSLVLSADQQPGENGA